MGNMRNELNFEVGCRIRNLREYAHYTREVLAEKADISVQFLADIETGRKSMTVKTLRNIAQSLHVSADYIIFGSSSPEDKDANSSNLFLMFERLTPKEKHYAEEILKLYIDALSCSKSGH